MDPIHQFQIQNLLTFGHIGGHEIAFTNSALFMALAVAGIAFLMIGLTRRRALVPSRLQSLAEISYEFVGDTLRSATGEAGMKFFPFVFTIFMFVLILNLFGMLPYGFTVTSHIIITFAMAAIVIGTVIIYGLMQHGTHWFHLFVPAGVHPLMLVLLVPIEVISFLSRPISLSVRLFANMLAGHIALKIFAGFVAILLTAGAWAIVSPLPLFLAVALTALEVLVAVLQAYVFATLTSIYLNDALHPGH